MNVNKHPPIPSLTYSSRNETDQASLRERASSTPNWQLANLVSGLQRCPHRIQFVGDETHLGCIIRMQFSIR